MLFVKGAVLCFAGVKGLRPGDAVFGLAPGCFGPTVELPEGLMVRMPTNLSFVQAATLPTVFVTVFEAFGAQGLQAGQKVIPFTEKKFGQPVQTCMH